MKWSDIGGEECSMARALSVIGDRWTLLVLREAFLRTRRFDDFHERIGCTRHILADRLKALVDHGVLEKRLYQEKPARHEYRLTRMGRDLYPVILSIVHWGDTYMAGPGGPPLKHRHRTCGKLTKPVLTCSACGDALNPRDVTPEGRFLEERGLEFAAKRE